MKTENRLFAIVMVSMFIFAAIYAYVTYINDNPAYGVPGEIEMVGFLGLIFSGLLHRHGVARVLGRSPAASTRARRTAPTARSSDVSGEVGFFSPGSYWPLGLALTAVVAGLGVVFWLPWLITAGFVALLFAVGGLVFEYYTGTRKLSPP